MGRQYIQRTLRDPILEDLDRKIILITGPRQVGKTTLAKGLGRPFDYINFDNPEHRLLIKEKGWDRKKELIIFDELHKMQDWKSWIKGIYDTEGIPPALVVTGSSKPDAFRKVGDSLAGRFFRFRLHPLDLKEIKAETNPHNLEEALENLMALGGFPEPFLEGKVRYYNRWKATHLDIILRQDLIDLEKINQIASMETLIQLLRQKIGSPVSYSSLARDLQHSDKTIKRWLEILENMYIIFRVPTYHKNVARALLKAPKFYFYDTGQVLGDEGIKLENLVACALLKEIHFREDCYGETLQLHYLRRRDGKEVDFCITKNNHPRLMLEVKWADSSWSPNFNIFEKQISSIKKVQLVKELKREKTFPNNAEMRLAHNWLSTVEL